MAEKIPSVDKVQYLTDWGKLESMLASARGRSALDNNTPPPPPPPTRTSPTLEDLGKAVDLEKLRKMFDERERQPVAPVDQQKPEPKTELQATPEAPVQSTQAPRPFSEKSEPPRRPPSSGLSPLARRNADMARWSLAAVAYSAAEFLAGSKSPAAGLSVLVGAATASAALLKKYGQPSASESLYSSVQSTLSMTENKENPASFRTALEEVSPQAKALFAEMDKVSSTAPKRFSPKDPASVQDMASALEAHGVEKAVSSYYAIYRGTAPPLSRPSSGLKVERGMRREGGDRVRVMGGF